MPPPCSSSLAISRIDATRLSLSEVDALNEHRRILSSFDARVPTPRPYLT